LTDQNLENIYMPTEDLEFNIDELRHVKAALLLLEKYKLYTWVKQYKPKRILEIGTGEGGSTSIMAKALLEASGGEILTCDPNRKIDQTILDNYHNIKYYQTTSKDLIKRIIDENIAIDFLFFDGPEIPETALEDLQALEEAIPTNCMFAMHDWEYEPRVIGGQSCKAKMIRPYIESSPKWRKVEVLSGLKRNSDKFDTHLASDSVGLCLYEFGGNRGF